VQSNTAATDASCRQPSKGNDSFIPHHVGWTDSHGVSNSGSGRLCRAQVPYDIGYINGKGMGVMDGLVRASPHAWSLIDQAVVFVLCCNVCKTHGLPSAPHLVRAGTNQSQRKRSQRSNQGRGCSRSL